jgi:hypothetical protein
LARSILVNDSAATDKLVENERNGCIDSDMKKVKELHGDIPSEWHYFVGLMRQQRASALERFEDWESLPPTLLNQLETYLPEDPAVLVGFQEFHGGVSRSARPPVWLHMDIMTDNIQMAPYSGDNHVPGLVDLNPITCGNKVSSFRQHLKQLIKRVARTMRDRIMTTVTVFSFLTLIS